jgi:hypothetical protein
MPLSVSGGQEFSLSGAQKNERNILARLQRSHATKQLFQDLWEEREKIQAVVAHHLGLHEPSACTVQERDTWLLGQFNICIIVRIHGKDGTTFKKIFRCPMAHKVGERYSPGAVDEKIKAEVATYAWIETNCPAIPVPRLHGFGFSSDLQVCCPYSVDSHQVTYLNPTYSSRVAEMAEAMSKIHPTAGSTIRTYC